MILMALLCHYLWCQFLGTESGQVGSPGAQRGIGILAVAACELGIACVAEDETEAAATPARTTERAKMRMASFIEGNSLMFGLQKTCLQALLQSRLRLILNHLFV